MIVSASYRTDIPAYYGAWFINRLRAGFCLAVNPYGQQIYRVPLSRREVDGFVFWTRNAAPFMNALAEVRERGFPFMVQYTITGYPRALERSAPGPARAVEHLRRIARAFGARVAVWRYDPVLITQLTPISWHAENFARLAGALRGASDEVVVSFAHVYRKTRRNLSAAARAHGFWWRDPPDDEKRALAARLADIADAHGMRLTLCAQPAYAAPGTAPARCVDADRLADVAGRALRVPVKGNRPGCLCHESRDIGAYDTCPTECVYCYAVSGRALARRRHRAHDPNSAFLAAPPTAPAAAAAEGAGS